MAVKASAETIREMKKQIAQTIKDIERINQGIKSGIRATGSWDDAKAAVQYAHAKNSETYSISRRNIKCSTP